jgi:hypothetical protein
MTNTYIGLDRQQNLNTRTNALVLHVTCHEHSFTLLLLGVAWPMCNISGGVVPHCVPQYPRICVLRLRKVMEPVPLLRFKHRSYTCEAEVPTTDIRHLILLWIITLRHTFSTHTSEKANIISQAVNVWTEHWFSNHAPQKVHRGSAETFSDDQF